MNKQLLGMVCALWRYPVKSMLGEDRSELVITSGGALGDRAWALREVVNGRVVTAKKWPNMFQFRAAYTTEPSPSETGSVLITMPDGKTVRAEDPDASAVLSAAFGRKVRLERAELQEKAYAGIDPSTVFGDVPVDKVIPGVTAATMPDRFALRRGSFFDSAAIHVIATGTLEHARKLRGGEGIFDQRRFRANIYVQTELGLSGFVEDGWLGGVVEVGEGVRITGMKPALRCVMTTHPQGDLPRDYGILRVAAEHHQANLGVFAEIESPGRVRLGDPVFLLK